MKIQSLQGSHALRLAMTAAVEPNLVLSMQEPQESPCYGSVEYLSRERILTPHEALVMEYS